MFLPRSMHAYFPSIYTLSSSGTYVLGLVSCHVESEQFGSDMSY